MPVTRSGRRSLGVAMAVSLAVHAALMSFSRPAPRVSMVWASATPDAIDVILHEPEASPSARTPARVPLVGQSEPFEPSRADSADKEAVQVATSAAEPDAVHAAPPVAPERLPAPPPDVLSANTSELLSAYGQTISRALARYKQYPVIAQERGWEGSVTMQLHVAPTGRLLEAEVRSSSGYEVLDMQALAMASRANPYPVPPEALLRAREIAVLVPVVFRLER
jgi:periplasmic protein TonB